MAYDIKLVSVCDICNKNFAEYIFNNQLRTHIAICNKCLKKECIKRNILIKEFDIFKEKI